MQTFLWCIVSNLGYDLTNQVTDLKEALKARGLEGKGTKAVLKERLLQALEEEEEEEEAAPMATNEGGGAEETDEGNDSDDAADSAKNDNSRTPTNGALSSDEVG